MDEHGRGDEEERESKRVEVRLQPGEEKMVIFEQFDLKRDAAIGHFQMMMH